jgi:hypothetical protein
MFEVRWASICGMLGSVSKGGHIPTPRGAMTQSASVLFKSGWISLAIIGLAILIFGLITTVVPDSGGPPYLRAIGVASIGMGLFGLLITTIAYRRRERWTWFALWYYPVFWTAHLVGGLPPGKDHIHQVVFIVVSLAGLLLPVREFFPRRGTQASTTR